MEVRAISAPLSRTGQGGIMSTPVVLGDPLYTRDSNGRLTSQTLTVFPYFDVIVTYPMPHAFQIEACIEWLNRQRESQGRPALTPEEEQEVREDAVAGVIEHGAIQLRPDPQNMPLAFRADRLLQKLVSKQCIKFLNVLNPLVRDALKRRGECWRMARLPTSRDEMKQRILAAKRGIRGREIYYYNATTGTRWLTCHEFARLAELDETELRRHLEEIREFSRKLNPQRNPEIAFYMADESFSGAAFEPCDFASMSRAELLAVYEGLCSRFRDAVAAEFQDDDLENGEWRHRMFSVLVTENAEVIEEEVLLSLSAEFYMQIQWLPGGRMINGELAFDELFEEDQQDPCAENAREFLYNLVREYEDLDYVNIGKVVNSLSRRSWTRGRREVYLAVMKRRGLPRETVSIIRIQKWGVREHLDEGRFEPDAMSRSDEYTEYVLDRRFACRYLGMNIPKRVTARKICERYFGPWTGPTGYMIWTPYFERLYIPGIASDKMPRQRLCDPEFALKFASLLGQAAAPNLIVGRCDSNHNVLFDDGDEIIVERERRPAEI
ncbi:MAG: hypothetical protein GXX91_00670, partial [Verrucomicrobiaceae bacterium]|nr:hypothetical protein [Verrucomicrobiaceae bacterium]